jgi:retinoid hydroxylase
MASAIPGVSGLLYFGEIFAFRRDPFAFAIERTRQHGPVWRTKLLGQELVFFTGPQACALFFDRELVARDEAAAWGAARRGDRAAGVGGEKEERRRREQLVLSAFTDRAMASYAPLLERIAARYVARWAGHEQAIGGALRMLAFDVANAMFAGADPEVSHLARAADLDTLAQGEWAPRAARLAGSWAPFTAHGKAMRARDRMHAYLGKAIALPSAPGTVLSALKTARDAEGRGLTATELEHELLHLFRAARAGLASALAWTTVALAQAPQIARGMREELTTRSAGALARPLTGAFCREVARAYPISPSMFLGVARRDFAVGQLRIARGTQVASASWAMLQDDGAFAMPASPRSALAQLASPSLRSDARLTRLPGPRCPSETLTTLMMQLYARCLLQRCELALPAQDLSFGPGGADGMGPLPASGLVLSARRRPELRLVAAAS